MTSHETQHKPSIQTQVDRVIRDTPSAVPTTATHLLMLQQTIGNQAVQRLLMKTPQTGAPRLQRNPLVVPGVPATTAKLTHSTTNNAMIPLGGAHPNHMLNGRLLIMVQVSPAGRGNGYATTLINQFLALFGGEQCYLEVMPSNDQPLNAGQLSAWYGRHGWHDTGLVNDTGHMIMTNNLLGVAIQPMPQEDEDDSEGSGGDEDDSEGSGDDGSGDEQGGGAGHDAPDDSLKRGRQNDRGGGAQDPKKTRTDEGEITMTGGSLLDPSYGRLVDYDSDD